MKMDSSVQKRIKSEENNRESMSKRVSLQMHTNGRVTIPRRYRDYFEMPDPSDDQEVWLDLEIHGLDEEKHAGHKFAEHSPNE